MVANRSRLCAAVAVFSLATPVLAEEVYDFGKGLVDRFGFVDLAKTYFERASKNTNLTSDERLEATLGLGTVSKLLAERQADSKEREKLYSDARELASKFLASAGESHPKSSVANDLLATIQRDLARAKIRAAEEETDILRKKELRAEAREIYEKVVEKRAKARKAAWDLFEPMEQRYLEEDPGTAKKIRPDRDKLALEAATAMQLYYQDKLSMVKVFEEDDFERKGVIESLVEELTAEVEERWGSEDFKGVELSARFFLGQAHALAGDYEKAKTEGFNHVLEEDPSQYRDLGYKWIRGIQLHTYYFKAKAAFDAKEYEDAAKTVRAMLNPPQGYADARTEDIGKAAYLLQGEAYAAQEKYEEAMGAVVPVASVGGQWLVNATKAISIYMDEAKEKKKEVRADAMIYYYSGDGHYKRALSAREKGDPKEEERMFELAVSDLSEAIRQCRGRGTALLSRYKYEPRCWQEMGLAYYHLGLFYESALSFEAVLKNFAPHLVGEELSRHGQYAVTIKRIKERLLKEQGERPTDAMVYAEFFSEISKRQEFKEILPQLAEDVKKSANNFKVALKARKKQSRSRFDSGLYAYALRLLIETDPSRKHEAEFYLAQELDDEAGRAKADGRPKEAFETYLRAIDAYLNVKKRARLYEVALYKAGVCYYRMMSIVVKKDKERAADYGRKALEQFQVYLDHINSAHTTDKLLRKQREKYSVDVQIYSPLTRFALGEYEEAVKGFEEYLEREDRDPKYVTLMAWNRFKCYYQLARNVAGAGDLGGFDKHVAEADKVASAMPDDATMSKYFVTACNYMVAVYNKGSNAAEEKGDKESYGRYQARLAEWMDLMPGGDWTLKMRTGTTFHRLSMYDKAVKSFEEALRELDADGDGIGSEIRQEDAFWDTLKKEIMLDEQETTAAARKKLDLIKDYIFDAEDLHRVPAEERKEEFKDYAKALSLVIGIIGDERGDKKGKHPDIQIKKFLADLRDELTVRLGVQYIRKLTSECYPAMAREAEERQDKDKAKEYWTKAAGDFEKLLEYFWADMSLRISLADALTAIAKFETDKDERKKFLNRTVDLYAEISIKVEDGSEQYYTALVKRCRALFDAERWEDARKFAKLLLETDPEAVKDYFPDAAEFVEKCEVELKKLGVAFEGEAVDIEEMKYEQFSTRDENLRSVLKRIDKLIGLGKLKAEEKDAEVLAVYKKHLNIMLPFELKQLRGQFKSKEISKERYEFGERRRVYNYLYSWPFDNLGYRKEAEKLGLLDEKFHGCKVEFLDEPTKKRAIELGYLTEKGEKLPEAPPAPEEE